MAKAALEERIRGDLQEAIRQKETVAANILRLLVSAIDNASIAKDRQDLSDAEVEQTTSKLAKKVQESIAAYDQAGRHDLLAEEQAQYEVLEKYLPEPLTSEELTALIKKTIAELGVSGPQAMGQVMGKVREQVGNRADGALVAQIVREQLA